MIMRYSKVTIKSIIVVAIFAMPLVVVAQDEAIHGQPFQKLQEQIDNIQAGIANAYSVNSGYTEITTDPEVTEVMSIDLPPGDYVSNISLDFRYTYFGGFEADAWAFVECKIYAYGDETGYGLGGNVCGQMGHSTTQVLSLDGGPTTVTLECVLGSECCGENCTACVDNVPLELLGGSWTLIRVDLQ
jgi:hypothetical protein